MDLKITTMKRFKKPLTGHKSYESALNGVSLYVQNYHNDLIQYKDINQFFSKLGKLMRKFLKENDLNVRDNGKDSSNTYNANIIQNNWSDFKKWLRSQ